MEDASWMRGRRRKGVWDGAGGCGIKNTVEILGCNGGGGGGWMLPR